MLLLRRTFLATAFGKPERCTAVTKRSIFDFQQTLNLASRNRTLCTNLRLRKKVSPVEHFPSKLLSKVQLPFRRTFSTSWLHRYPTPVTQTPPQTPRSETGLSARLNRLWKQYGLISVGVYTILSAADLALFFWIISIGGASIIKPAEELAKKYLPDLSNIFGKAGEVPHVTKEIEDIQSGLFSVAKASADLVKTAAVAIKSEEKPSSSTGYDFHSHSWWSTFVIAYGFHKLFLPIRVPIAAMITPAAFRWFTRKGFKVVGWKITRIKPQ